MYFYIFVQCLQNKGPYAIKTTHALVRERRSVVVNSSDMFWWSTRQGTTYSHLCRRDIALTSLYTDVLNTVLFNFWNEVFARLFYI